MTRVLDVVAWRVEPARTRSGAASRLAWVVSVAGELIAGAGAGPISGIRQVNPVLGPDPDEDLGLDLEASGNAPWLSRYADVETVWLSQAGAWIGDPSTRVRATPVPLEWLTPIALNPARDGDPRTADAIWVLSLAGTSTTVQFRGPLSGLAWLAYLAGWDEPSSA